MTPKTINHPTRKIATGEEIDLVSEVRKCFALIYHALGAADQEFYYELAVNKLHAVMSEIDSFDEHWQHELYMELFDNVLFKALQMRRIATSKAVNEVLGKVLLRIMILEVK